MDIIVFVIFKKSMRIFKFHNFVTDFFFLEAAPVIDSSSNEEEDEEDGCVRCLRNKEDDQVCRLLSLKRSICL